MSCKYFPRTGMFQRSVLQRGFRRTKVVQRAVRCGSGTCYAAAGAATLRNGKCSCRQRRPLCSAIPLLFPGWRPIGEAGGEAGRQARQPADSRLSTGRTVARERRVLLRCPRERLGARTRPARGPSVVLPKRGGCRCSSYVSLCHRIVCEAQSLI